MIIGIDFDGTCVTHAFPKVGEVIGSVPILNKLVDAGHHLILFTMRSDSSLDDAVKWFEQNGLPLYGVNVNPTQHKWTNSPKAYCHYYIDDAAIGIPLIRDYDMSARPFVNWTEVNALLIKEGLLQLDKIRNEDV